MTKTHNEVSRRKAFLALLEQQAVPYRVRGDVLTVQDNLWAPPVDLLPDDLVVKGTLNLNGSKADRLPERLVVHHDLMISGAPLTALPASLSVMGNLWAEHSQLSSLPEGFRVGGRLHLGHSPIAALPEGLDIGGNLNLAGTPITRLPRTLSVGRALIPPSGLHDIQAFMSKQSGPVVFPAPTSAHHRLAMMQELRAFPDLWTVVAALGPAHQLRLCPQDTGGYTAEIL